MTANSPAARRGRPPGTKMPRKYACVGVNEGICEAKVAYPHSRCRECVKVKRAAEYQKHKAEVTGRMAVYYQEHKEDRAAYDADYQRKNKAKLTAYRANYRQEHKEVIDAKNIAYRLSHKEQKAAYQKEHPEVWQAATARRRTQGTFRMTGEDRELSRHYRQAIKNDPCFYCGAPGEHVDHYRAMADGGTDHWWNLVRACARCNRRKQAMHGDDFLKMSCRLATE